LDGTTAATATSPSWSCSRVMVNFMPFLVRLIELLLLYI